MTKRPILSLGLIVALAVVLTVLEVPLASSQGITLSAAQVTGELPVSDPNSDLWREASAVIVPLSAQNVARPILSETKVKSVTARALVNDSQLAILVEWADGTQNDSMVRVQDFRDAVALQFPLVEGQPFFCMGQQGGDVNIWHWKADWQADVAARQDMETVYPDMHVDQFPFADPLAGLAAGPDTYIDPNYLPALASGNPFAAVHASPVEDLIAGGFGSLTAQPADAQNVQGYDVWADGTWRVIFSRDLASGDDGDISFAPGKVYPVAFAAWDGANAERNGQKSISQWVSLQVGQATPPAQTTPEPASVKGVLWGIVPVLAVTLLLIGLTVAVSVLLRLSRKE